MYGLAGTVNHASRVAAREHHAVLDGQGQPVTPAPAQRGDGRPVSDPARSVDAAEAIGYGRSGRRAYPAASDGRNQVCPAGGGRDLRRG
jgi:hypothetical protein